MTDAFYIIEVIRAAIAKAQSEIALDANIRLDAQTKEFSVHLFDVATGENFEFARKVRSEAEATHCFDWLVETIEHEMKMANRICERSDK